MVSKVSSKNLKVIAILAIVIVIIGLLVGKIYSTDNSHYVVDVVEETATSNDGKVQITEKIVKGDNQQFFNSKELDYEVELKNTDQAENLETQVAIVVDSSYSMQINDSNNVLKNKAIELASGILTNVDKSRVSISNNKNTKVNMTNYNTQVNDNINVLTTQINSLITGEGNDSNVGLENAKNSFSATPIKAGDTINKYIIVFTDATDSVTTKMQDITTQDPNIKIISILVDMSSDSYIVNNEPVCGELYLLLSEVAEENNTIENIELLDAQKIYDIMSNSINKIEVSNEFSTEILEYFDIEYKENESNGQLTKNSNGYTWKVDTLKGGKTATLKFKLKLKTNKSIDAAVIFKDLYTNKIQDIEYEGCNSTLKGTDSRIGTESTVIKICQGYDLKIKAVNESNKDLQVEGINFKVIGTNKDGTKVCDIEKTTDSNGYITITPDDARALRTDGTITFEVTPIVNKTGYTNTDSISFDITNDITTRNLGYNNYNNNNFEININETKRLVDVIVPINSKKMDFELKVEELNNSNKKIAGCEFQLIQPKLNNNYEMTVLTGTTDATGTIHFSPTVMTKPDTYNYVLNQISGPDGYVLTTPTIITIKFEADGTIKTEPTTQFNPNIKGQRIADDHVLFTLGLENNRKDPFDLQINLTDKTNGTKLQGARYLIRTINVAQNIDISEEATTNQDGQINAKIYGDGNFAIEITEQSPTVGYVADTKKKIINVERLNGFVRAWSGEINANDIEQNNDKDNLIINLYSQKKTEQNIVKVSLVDANEQDVAVGKDVIYHLKDDTGKEYGPAISNRNGELEFVIDQRQQGQYRYTLVVDPNTIPSEYNQSSANNNIIFNLNFDADGYIDGINLPTPNTNVINTNASTVSKEDFVEHTAFIKIAYELDLNSTVEFRIQLFDKDEVNGQGNFIKPIEGAQYKVKMQWDVTKDGQILKKERVIEGRSTNNVGQISTRIVRADEMIIEVTQIKAALGYNADNTTTQEIHLKFRSNGMIDIINQTPYDMGNNNTNEPYQGAYISNPGNPNPVIIYQHLNKKRSVEDTYVNLVVNKIDMNGAYVDGVILNIKSDTLVDKDNNKLDFIMKTGEQGSQGSISISYTDYLKDIINSNTIRVPGIGQTTDTKVHEMYITEMQADKNSPTGYSEKDGTKVKVVLTFRYRDNRVRLDRVETTWGNNLVIDKQFSSSSDDLPGQQLEDSMGVFLGNVILDLRTNYEEVGNLSIDFKKMNDNQELLTGATYDLKVTNDDGTVIRKNGMKIENGSNSSDIEIPGIKVNKGSTIEITETKAPIGYALNKNTEILEVTDIDGQGEITLEVIRPAYNPSRINTNKIVSTITTAGGLKTNYEVTLIDQQLDTFEFEITTKDNQTHNGVSGFGFKIDSNKNATSSLTTGANGIGKTTIGGSIENDTITYTVSLNKVADYYKPLNSLINVNVVFDQFGKVDVSRTQNAQTDPNYGTLWNITTLNPTDRGPIGIEVFVEHQDPLVVNVETIDKITNKTITDVSYKIEKSEVLPATGSSTIQVGYILENGTRTYNLIQTSLKNTYKAEANKSFTVTYANETIDSNPTKTYLNSTTPEDTLEVTGDKEIKIKVYVEPKVPIEITNTYYFDENIKLQGAEFEVISKRTQEKKAAATDANGVTVIYSDLFGPNDGDKVTYQIRQTKAKLGYATIEDFYVTVTYNANREIISAKLTDQNGTELPDGSNRFIRSINVSKDDTKYNFNNKGIVQIEVSNYPEFQIEIENIDRRNGNPISGTTYSVKSTYQETDGSIVNFTQTMNPAVTGTDGIGAGKGIAHLDKTKDNGVIKYTIKEDKPAQGYQSFGKDINIIVRFDENGLVKQDDDYIEIENQNSKIERIIKIDPIIDSKDNFKVKLQLENNPILKFNITKIDDTNNNKIDGVGFTIVSRIEGDNKVYSYSSATQSVNQKNTAEISELTGNRGIQGHTALYLDRTIDNKTMEYTIEEVQKAPGYKWIADNMIVKVEYDEDGKIYDYSIKDGQGIVELKGFDKENFVIDLEIKNILIEEFGINLVAEDAYSNEKRINDLKVEAFLVQKGDSYYQTPDSKYNLTGGNSLLTGADRNNDGKPDEYGKDYLSMGKYTDGAGRRYLRLVIKNETAGTGEATNGSYYKQNSSQKTLGYYRGNEFVQDAYYQAVAYDYLISVDFDDNGKIVDSELIVGNNISGLGVTVDNQYIKTKNGNKIEHDDYKLDITMKLFPLLRLSIHGMDNYTWEDEQKTNSNGLPTELPGTKYTISTQRHTEGPTTRDEYVTAGYRGQGHYLGTYQGMVYGDIYESKKDVLYAPIEKATTENPSKRLYYVFEDAEPTNYQKYTPWHYDGPYYTRLVAIISIEFDELGEFKTESYDFIDRSRYSNITLAQGTTIKAINNTTGELEDRALTQNEEVSIISVNGSTVEGRLKDGTRIQFTLPSGAQLTNRVFKANQGEFGDFLSDCDNLQDYDYFGTHNTAKRSLDFYIGYALTTKINVTAIDDISGSRISNIRMTPLLGGTYTTNRSYYYTTDNYRDTDSNGKFDMKYWGAAEQNATNEYIIGSNRQGDDYNGYFFPSDMASLVTNGSGNPADYYAKIEVTYDEKGKINGVVNKGIDLWGDKNSQDDFTRTIITSTGQVITQQVSTSYDSATGNVYIKMLYSRKFQVSLNKIDSHDNSINTLDASFNVTAELPSGYRLNTTIRSNRKNSAIQLTPLGKVFKGTPIKYTLQETKAPQGYLPIDSPIDFVVEFDKDGNIGKNSIKSDSKYFELESTSKTTEGKNKTSPDLTIKIKNDPAFILNLRVIDKFYKTDGISDIYFDIENNKGEKALGVPQTDANGYTHATVGKIYPGEEIVYTIRQSNNKEPDYYRNDTEIKLRVVFNNSGKIKEYNIISPGINDISEVVNNFNTTAYILKKEIGMEIMNMPKALKIGLNKYDKTTNQVMPDVKFTVTRENVNNPLDSNKDNPVEIQTNPVTGSVVEKIDEFTKGEKTIKYTIHEVETPASYRTMEDVVLEVKYRADGSIERCNAISNDNGILNTDVRTEIARNSIKYMNGQDPQKQERVHLIAKVPNDNTYDLIIRNEDINYTQGQLGIEGSQFDVNITANGTGQVYKPALTDTNGMTILRDLTHNGDITISIAQKTAGEGYKYDVDNKVVINLEKGVNIYSIDLKQVDGQAVTDDKNATTTKAIIKVDEKYGKITVTFKNETKTELTILKQDVNNKKVLQNAEFEVTKQQVDNNGNPIGDTTILTATSNSTATDKDGKLHFELGVAPQSQIWVYTFREITPPEGYNQIIDLTMKVTYDQYGRIISQESNERTRLLPTREHTNNNNCRSMYAIIYNGDISPAYTLKVVTEDTDTGKRINGSKIYMNITDNNGSSVPINQKNQTEGSAQNGQTDVTGILGANWKKYTEAQWNDPNISKPLRLEEGLVYIDSIDYQGTLNIEVSQNGLAPGYIYGNQKTGGTVQIEAKYIPQLGGNPTLELTAINDDGFGSNLKIDNVNRTITIIIKNESEVLFKISTMEYKSNPNAQPTYLPVNYDITAEIQTLTGSEETDIKNKTTHIEAGDYKAIGNVGKAYAGRIVLYTLHQHTPLGYKAIDDIKVEVQYDTQGYIKYYEILSSEDNAYLDIENTGGRTISLIVVNRKTIAGYRIDVEKHAMDTDDDKSAYGKLLPGADFRVTVTQEFNDTNKVEWEGTTDKDGLIEGKILNGVGYINVTIEELGAPIGYTLGGIKSFKFYRNPDTGEFEKVGGDVNMEDADFKTDPAGNSIITLKPIDEQEKTKFTLIFNKYSNQTKELIKDNTAEFKATLIREDGNGNIIYKDVIQNISTDINGKAIKDNITMPKDEGEYKLIIEETKAPEGYNGLSDPIEIPVTFGRDKGGNIIITGIDNTSIKDLENISTTAVKPQLIGMNIGNEFDQQIKDDEYSLDITKVDGKTGKPIKNSALFKVWIPDDKNTEVYTETSVTELGPGKLDYCYIEQDKDYQVRLSHMKLPKEEGELKYVFREITPPEGYVQIKEDLVLTLKFEKDATTGKMFIADATSSNDKYLRINSKTPWQTNEKFSVDILNYEDKLFLKSKEYLIGTGVNPQSIWSPGIETEYEDGDKYIKGIRPQAYQRENMSKTKGTTIEEFINNLNHNAEEIKIYIPEVDANGNKVLKEENVIKDNQRLVATGMVLKAIRGSQEIELTLIVRGDFIVKGSTIGNGYLDQQDITAARAYNPRRNPILNDIEKQAFDFCIDTNMGFLQQQTAINYSYTNKTTETVQDSRKPRQ